ncbi:MAG: penicillin-binding protein 2 [Candidatus Omnitrophota bacterium]
MRIRALRAVIIFIFSLLVIGLFYTQIVNYHFYKKLSENNRIRVLPLAARRGRIYDHKARLLANSRISFDVQVIFREMTEKDTTIKALAKVLEINPNTLSEKIKKASLRPFVPVKVAEDIPRHKAINIEEMKFDLPGVIVTTSPVRNYLYGETFSHIIGYLGEINEDELVRYKTYGYHMQDFVGKDGVEREYNDYLRGVDGGLQVEVDSKGRQLRNIAMKEPTPGKDLYLSVDLDLQKFCSSLLEGQKGAILAMNPETGDLLALVSHPSFDPNMFTVPDNSKEIYGLLKSSDYPMLNRAISGTYPPGSVFKVVVAAAALDAGEFEEHKTFFCNGSYNVGNRVFHCWKEEGHGEETILNAIKDSCNVFFYQLGLTIGVDQIAKYAFLFGLGRRTGIDLPGEALGVVPTTSWKKKQFNKPWYKGETANYSIGQGYLLVTPIQILRLYGILANGGGLVQPFVVARIEDVKLSHGGSGKIDISKSAIDTIREALKSVVNAKHGTGFYAKSNEIIISGKTGTAQNPAGKSHAWFACFAPFDNPQICVVVFIEQGEKGGLKPASFAKKIIEKAKALELIQT